MAYQLILTTCPDQQSAETLAIQLLEAKLAACINILPGLKALYHWKGQIESADEHLLIIKTRADKYHEIEIILQKSHPYELPEIIAVPIERGLPEYLQWIESCLASD